MSANYLELVKQVAQQLEPIFDDDTFCDDVQNKTFVENLDEACDSLDAFSWHFRKIYSVLEEEGPKEWYDKDYDYLSTQLKNAKQHLSQILM